MDQRLHDLRLDIGIGILVVFVQSPLHPPSKNPCMGIQGVPERNPESFAKFETSQAVVATPDSPVVAMLPEDDFQTHKKWNLPAP